MVRPAVPWRILAGLYSLIFATGAVVTAVVAWSPLDVVVGPALWAVALGFLIVAIGVVYGLTGRNPAIATLALCIGAMMVGGQVARVLDFVTKAMGYPLADATLASWDALLGLDWRSYHDWLLEHEHLAAFLAWLYKPTQLFVAAAIILLTVRGRLREAASFALAIAVTLVICVVIGGFLPAVGPYGYFGVPDHGTASWMEAIRDIATGKVTQIDLANLPALTTFPSYHSAVAILIVLASWKVGRIGGALAVVNLIWLVGVPVWGDHYFIDIFAGVAIGVLCHVALFGWLCRKTVGLAAPGPVKVALAPALLTEASGFAPPPEDAAPGSPERLRDTGPPSARA